jgi:DNA-binding IclR family transcriptional regulator
MIILSLAKAFRVLELLSESGSGLTLTELVSRLNISMGAAQRITNTLIDLGYLQREPLTKLIRLTPKFLIFNSGYFSQTELRHIVFPYMQKLNEQLDEVVNLGVMINDKEIIYVDRVDRTSHIITTSFRIGDRRPIHVNSIGRVIMAFLPEPESQKILDGISFDQSSGKRFGNKTDLMKELEKIRRQGYSAGTSESFDDIYSLAIPVLDYQRKAIAGINIVIPISRLSMDDIRARYIPLLMETAQELSRSLGNIGAKRPMKPTTKKERQV